MLNYYTIRIILSIVLTCIIYFLVRKHQQKNKQLKKHKMLSYFLFLFCYFLIWGINYEVHLLKFHNPQKAFFYYFPNQKISKVYELDDCACMLYKKDHSYDIICFIKKGEFWQSDKFIAIDKSHTQYYSDYTIFIKKLKQKKIATVLVFQMNRNSKNVTVEDSLSTTFDTIGIDNKYMSVGIVKYETLDDYFLKIGEERYKLRIN